MKKSLLILALFAFAAIVPVRAQFMQMGLKVQYAGTSVDEIVNDVSHEVKDFSTDFLKGCEGGIFLRFNIGRWITIQPEANFSIGAVWDSVDAESSFFNKVIATINNVKTVNLAVPVLASAHLIDIENLFALRAYIGPEFYTTIKGATEKNFDFSNYSIVGGVGVDLFGFLNVDARLQHSKGGNNFYKVGVGLLF